MDEKTLAKFAELVLKIGVNIQKNQGLEIICPTEKSEVAVAICNQAYKLGASIVNVRWENDDISRLNYLNASTETLTDIPKWFIESKNYLVKNNFCYIAIAAENPSAFKNVSAVKLAAVAKEKSKRLKRFSECVMANGIRWCVVSVPTYEWAKQVFPTAADPMSELSTAIEKTMRLDYENPIVEWETHIKNLEKRAEFLNNKNFEYLYFKNNLGTNLKIGLAKNHVWLSAKETAADGVDFIANMPTEEVFTAPHKNKIDGTVYSAMPLAYNGNIIDRFFITFKKGKVIDFGAQTGYDVLKGIIDTDTGSNSLGEVALIGKNSPIAKSGILFFNTLFDENASSHLALGKAYPTTVSNNKELSKSELKNLGVNDSTQHVDFMIGTDDLFVEGICYDGTKITLLQDGEWII